MKFLPAILGNSCLYVGKSEQRENRGWSLPQLMAEGRWPGNLCLLPGCQVSPKGSPKYTASVSANVQRVWEESKKRGEWQRHMGRSRWHRRAWVLQEWNIWRMGNFIPEETMPCSKNYLFFNIYSKFCLFFVVSFFPAHTRKWSLWQHEVSSLGGLYIYLWKILTIT